MAGFSLNYIEIGHSNLRYAFFNLRINIEIFFLWGVFLKMNKAIIERIILVIIIVNVSPSLLH